MRGTSRAPESARATGRDNRDRVTSKREVTSEGVESQASDHRGSVPESLTRSSFRPGWPSVCALGEIFMSFRRRLSFMRRFPRWRPML